MVLFSPNDHRLPRMLIPITDCPKDFRQRPNDYAKTLFIAQVRSILQLRVVCECIAHLPALNVGPYDKEEEEKQKKKKKKEVLTIDP